ncbi:hypothetical protein BH18ACI1_BH18ACI1_05990 [soil metagenome]|jgi:plasmid maintenance system killer protein|nr:hypothetical protein [Acidobacteriota bacterium]
MKIKTPKDNIIKYLKKHQIDKKFWKAAELFEKNMNHPSLNVEVLEPKHLKVYSFRVDKKYRAIFIARAAKLKL